MTVEWSKRPYTAPFLRDLIYDNKTKREEGCGSTHGSDATQQYKFVKHIPFARRVSTLPIADAQAGHMGNNGGCSSTLSLQSIIPSTTFGDQCSTKIRGSDIFFLPKPTQLLFFALPVFVLMPNLTVFTRQWFFYGPK